MNAQRTWVPLTLPLSLGGGRSRSTRNSIGRARRLPISPPRSDNDAKSGEKGAVEGYTSTRARVRDHLGSGTEAFPGDSPHTTPRKVDRRGQCQNTAQLDPACCTAAALRTSSTRCLLACLKHCGIWERNPKERGTYFLCTARAIMSKGVRIFGIFVS